MKWVLATLLLTSCVANSGSSAKRYPNHRKERDAQHEALVKRVTELEAKMADLQATMAAVLGQMKQLQQPPQPAVDAGPAP